MRERESISGREASLRGCARKQASEHAPVRTHAVASRHNDRWVSLALSHRAARVRASIPRASGSRRPFHPGAIGARECLLPAKTSRRTNDENSRGGFRFFSTHRKGLARSKDAIPKEGRKEGASEARGFDSARGKTRGFLYGAKSYGVIQPLLFHPRKTQRRFFCRTPCIQIP